MAQQTAVEWLAEQLKKQGFLYDLDIEAAKQMQKEQSEKDYYAGTQNFMIYNGFEKYYNETYGNNQNK